MDLAEAEALLAYDAWANARAVASLRALPVPELTRNLGSSFPTLRGTFAHLVGGEWIWLERWSGRSPEAAPAWLGEGPLEELVSVLGDVEARRAERLAATSGEALGSPVAFRYLDGKQAEFRLADILRHVVNHSTHHRGQLVTMVRQVGGDVRPMDFIAWCDARRHP